MRQTMSRRQFVATTAMLGTGLLTVPARGQSLEKITYLFPAPPVLPAFGPIRLAQGKGYFKEAGFEVEFAVGRGGVDVAKQVGAGNAPIGGIVADGPIMVRGNGVPVKIVCVFGGKGFMQLVVREDSGIKTAADLKGKNVGIQEPGGFADALSRAYLKKNGIDAKDVNFVTTTTAARVQQMVAGAIDTGILHVDQLLTIQKTAPNIKVLANMWEVLPDYQYAVYAMPAAKANGDLAECMMRAIIRASRAMYDPSLRDKIMTMAVRETKADAAIVQQAYTQLVAAKAWPQNEGVPKKNIDGTVAIQLESKQIDKALTFEQVTDLRAAARVVAQLGRKDFPY